MKECSPSVGIMQLSLEMRIEGPVLYCASVRRLLSLLIGCNLGYGESQNTVACGNRLKNYSASDCKVRDSHSSSAASTP
jgi:hypothetical protein